MLETVVTSSVLIAVLILLRAVFIGRIRFRLQYAVWLLAVLRLLLPFSLFESAVSVMNVAGIAGADRISPLPYVQPDMDKVSAPPAATYNIAYVTGVAPAPSAAPADTAATEAASLKPAAPSTEAILRTVWLTGAVAVALWFTVQNLRLCAALRRTRERIEFPGSRLPVYLTGCAQAPCLFGLIRPAVYLTRESLADPHAVPYILAHEETHFRHGDHFWSYLRCVCLALHWFNPLVWWAAALSRRDCELACDEGTLRRLGDEHRKAYGMTLINMVSGRMRPADLLCGATTMTSGLRGIKERVTMIAGKPRMLVSTLLIALLLIAAVAGCTFTGASNASDNSEMAGNTAPIGQIETSGSVEPAPLSAEELAYFNGDEFFNGDYLNIRNQFLSSLYDAPEKIDLYELFYCGSGGTETFTDAEQEALLAQMGWEAAPDCACTKISRAAMDTVLTGTMGLTLDDTAKTGLEKFTYLAEYDAYYVYHGDTNYRGFAAFSGGEREGGVLRLFYNDTFMADGEKILTLREQDGGYLFVSNVKTAENTEPSPAASSSPLEPGAVPDAVLDAANGYVQRQFNYWSRSTGAYGMVDGTIQMIGEPASYDTWRIDGLSLQRSFTELDGKPVQDFWQSGYDAAFDALDVYQLSYHLHTTTPDKVALPGGMHMDEDGWVWFNSPYLIFSHNNGNPVYLFAMIDEATPDVKAFPGDLINRLTVMKDARAEALSHLSTLFDDGASTIWYVANGENPAGPIPGNLSYTRNAQYEERYKVLFGCTWEPQSYYPEPSGPCLCLGDSPDRCFRFYLGSNLVFWHDGDSVTSWFADESPSTTVTAAATTALPDVMMFEFSGYELDIARVTIPEKSGESAEDTLRRYLDAYGAYLKDLTPENAYRITDFKTLDFAGIHTKGSRILLGFQMAVKPPEELYASTPWWAGNSFDGEGDLAGWLVMSREIVLELSEGSWRCIDYGTGGASLD